MNSRSQIARIAVTAAFAFTLTAGGWAEPGISGADPLPAADAERDISGKNSGNSPLIAAKSGIGPCLTDGRGMTLYYFKKDPPGRTACLGVCRATWLPFYTEKITAPAGSAPGDFGTLARPDGMKQNSFRGRPLYYFAGDRKPGDAKGHAVNGVWFAADPALAPLE
jgi:predicted lipoprotein with Yx(FWY)xxD motif